MQKTLQVGELGRILYLGRQKRENLIGEKANLFLFLAQ